MGLCPRDTNCPHFTDKTEARRSSETKAKLQLENRATRIGKWVLSCQTPSPQPALQTQALSFGTSGRSLQCVSLDSRTCQKSNDACLMADGHLEESSDAGNEVPVVSLEMPSRAGSAAHCWRGTQTRRAGSAPCTLLSELHSCPWHADRPRDL